MKRAPNGEIQLLASNAEIYGESLQYERAHRNLGYWGSEDDVAAGVVEVPARGSYSVAFEYACDESNGGNAFTLSVGEATVTGEVEATGGWERFAEKEVGAISLTPGTNRIAVRATEKPKDFLFDLRGIVLRPKQ